MGVAETLREVEVLGLDGEGEVAVVDGPPGWVDWACSKSAAREGSLGEVSVAVVAGEAKPWNCVVRS